MKWKLLESQVFLLKGQHENLHSSASSELQHRAVVLGTYREELGCLALGQELGVAFSQTGVLSEIIVSVLGPPLSQS